MQKSLDEEVVNAATHFISAVGVVLSTLLLLLKGNISNSTIAPIIIMGSTAAWGFFSSYLYHSSTDPITKERNRIVDKSAIYIMISGSGCAMSLLVENSFFSAFFCFIILLLSSIFIACLCSSKGMKEIQSLVSYILLGWLSFMPATGVFLNTPFSSGNTFILGILGALSYSIGVAFYVTDSRKWNHTLWHIFVMLGFTLHFTAVAIIGT